VLSRVTRRGPPPPPRRVGAPTLAASLPLLTLTAGSSLRLPEKERKPRVPVAWNPSAAGPGSARETEAELRPGQQRREGAGSFAFRRETEAPPRFPGRARGCPRAPETQAPALTGHRAAHVTSHVGAGDLGPSGAAPPKASCCGTLVWSPWRPPRGQGGRAAEGEGRGPGMRGAFLPGTGACKSLAIQKCTALLRSGHS
jgi:hypothetical protein